SNTLRAVTGNVAGDFAAAGRVADVDRLFQVQLRNELGEVVGVVVHVIAVPGLARAAVAAAIVGNASIPMRSQEKHLVFEGIRGERPAVAEDHRLSLTPILVIN